MVIYFPSRNYVELEKIVFTCPKDGIGGAEDPAWFAAAAALWASCGWSINNEKIEMKVSRKVKVLKSKNNQ